MLNSGGSGSCHEVVHPSSFSAAAESLSYTQSAVSQAIARLEAETGATLIVRDRRRCPPHRRRRDARRARRLDLRSTRRRRSRPRGGAGDPRGAAAARDVPVRRGDADANRRRPLSRRHPDVELTLAEGEPEEIAPRLRAASSTWRCCSTFPG